MYLRSIRFGLPSFLAGRSYWYLKCNVCFLYNNVFVQINLIVKVKSGKIDTEFNKTEGYWKQDLGDRIPDLEVLYDAGNC